MFPQRVFTCATVPDLLRADADRRAARSFAILPIEAWCRPAVIGVVWSYRGHGLSPLGNQPNHRRQRPALCRSSEDLARKPPLMREMKSQCCPMPARTRALARSRRAALQACASSDAHGVWSHRTRMRVCFAGASGILVVTRAMNSCGLLSPSGVMSAMA